jgi:hypothetical protein
MIFHRRVPPKRFAEYSRYRPHLRLDFQYRCAYCLRHEYYLGGEAGCCIDHYRPVSGLYGRPDLVAEYDNLYWCCRECNENKGDAWPSLELYVNGYRFLDPCNSEDDHDLHMRVRADGSLELLTNAGRFTCDTLRLWRAQLAYHRAEMFRCQEEVREVRARLAKKAIPKEQREDLDALLAALLKVLEPPVFDRPRRPENRG